MGPGAGAGTTPFAGRRPWSPRPPAPRHALHSYPGRCSHYDHDRRIAGAGHGRHTTDRTRAVAQPPRTAAARAAAAGVARAGLGTPGPGRLVEWPAGAAALEGLYHHRRARPLRR